MEPKMKDKVNVFVRIKEDVHCLKVITEVKRYNIKWISSTGVEAIISMDKIFYECEHEFIIKYPNRSCFTEVQLIKPKSFAPAY